MNRIAQNSVFTLGLLAVIGGGNAASATTYFPADATIDYSLSGNSVVGYANDADYLIRANGSSPKINVVSGSNVTGTLLTYNRSAISVSGGSLSGIIAYGSNAITVTGGSVGTLDAKSTSAVNITGGSVYNLTADSKGVINISQGSIGAFSAYKGSAVTFSGGSIGASVGISGASRMNFSGGSITGDLYATASAVNISGGHVSGRLIASGGVVNLSGGGFGGSLYVESGGALNLSGLDLSDTLIDPNYGNDPFTYHLYSLSGRLADGADVTGERLYVSNPFDGGGNFTITNVPEPGGAALFVGMAALSAGVLRRRRNR